MTPGVTFASECPAPASSRSMTDVTRPDRIELNPLTISAGATWRF